MSKTAVRKAIKDFDAPQLSQLIMELYGKSKEVKEILDFFAEPDIDKKIEQYKSVLLKEAMRYTHREHHPRIARLRAAIKRFRTLHEPGDEAVAELMVYTSLALVALGESKRHRETLYDSVGTFLGETLSYLKERDMLDEYLPRFRRAASKLKPLGVMRTRNLMLVLMEFHFERIGVALD